MTYFGGSTVRDGRVRKLAATTFRELVESQVFVPVAFSMTRQEFLNHENRDKLKDGPWICGAQYEEDETARGNQHATGFGMVIIDLDGPEAKPFAESPGTILDALETLNLVAWTTAKHTPDEPRIKIAVDCVQSDPLQFKAAVRHVADMLGLPPAFLGKVESGVISQPQYRPLHFRGEEFAAILASRLDGEPMETANLVEQPDTSRTYAYQLQGGEGDITSLLHLPIQTLTIEDCRGPLFAIDPDCGYHEWIAVASALRHQFTQEDDARQAFDMFDEWSSTGAKYVSTADTYAKWRSFRPYPKGREPVTFRSVYRMAMNAGWDSNPTLEKLIHGFRDWCHANRKDAAFQGPKRIAAMPIHTHASDEIMANILIDTIKSDSGKISKSALLSDIKDARKLERVARMSSSCPSWLAPFCFIGPLNTFRNVVTGAEYSVEAFNNTFSRNLVNPAEPNADGRTPILPAPFALNVADTKIVDAVIYDPREASGKEPYFRIGDRWFVNTYMESSVPNETVEGSKSAGRMIRKLISVNIPNEAYARTVLDFIAFCVQFPGRKIRWAILLQGAQGCGKGTLADTIRAAIGQPNFKVVNGSVLNGKFNEWMEGASCVYCDELFSAGVNRHEVNTKMKDAVSNTYIPVDRKFRDVVNIPNVSNYIFSTNKHDALLLEESDRRYFVLKSALQTKAQVQHFTDTGLMQMLHGVITSNPGAIRHFYLNHRISEDFDPDGHAPETIYRNELIEQGKNALLIQIEDLIDDPAHPLIGQDLIHYGQLERETALLSRNNARPSHYLHMLGYTAIQNGQVFEVNGERTRIYAHSDRFVEGLECHVETLEKRISDEI